MLVESLDFAYHRGVDSKITYTLNWTQILLLLCKRPNKVYPKRVLGQKVCSMCSAFDFDRELTSCISIFKAAA